MPPVSEGMVQWMRLLCSQTHDGTTTTRQALFAGIRHLMRQRELITILIIALTALVFHMLTLSSKPDTWPSLFANARSLRAMLSLLALDVTIAVGMLIVLVGGGFDLSVGAVVALAALAAGKVINQTGSIPLAFLAGIGVGALVGSVNGTIITRFGVNPLIATLGTMSIGRGLVVADVERHGVTTGFPKEFQAIALDQILGISGGKILVTAVVIAIIGDILLRNSRWLRQVYYVGGNETAARLSGINVEFVRATTYVVCACLAALVGVFYAARYTEASAEAGVGLELQTIAACVIGGASLAGGQGTVLGAVLGCVLMVAIRFGLQARAVAPAWQMVALGVVLVTAVTIDMWIARRRRVG